MRRMRSSASYFNPRSRMGSDCRRTSRRSPWPDFNPRSRMGSDHPSRHHHLDQSYFNPRSRMGSDPSGVDGFTRLQISIHAPAWGATAVPSSCPSTRTFQSTLPHGERPATPVSRPSCASISIHAPAWGATIVSYRCRILVSFQSTLPHGERLLDFDSLDGVILFQSTLPHRERRRARPRQDLWSQISIHAPAWGATDKDEAETHFKEFQSTLPHGERQDCDAFTVTSFRNFNPRSRMGSDACFASTLTGRYLFQSTLPHGERPPNQHKKAGRPAYFNPRSRMGSDWGWWSRSWE